MKLIIDIDEEVYKRIKDRHPEPNDSYKCQDEVLYGKPYKEKQGEWIHNGVNIEGMDLYRCSICNRSIVTWSSRVNEYPYCHCGAKMKGGAE